MLTSARVNEPHILLFLIDGHREYNRLHLTDCVRSPGKQFRE